MKSEKEKMLSGELYDAADIELIKDRKKARELTRLINTSMEIEDEKRIGILKNFLGKRAKIYT